MDHHFSVLLFQDLNHGLLCGDFNDDAYVGGLSRMHTCPIVHQSVTELDPSKMCSFHDYYDCYYGMATKLSHLPGCLRC